MGGAREGNYASEKLVLMRPDGQTEGNGLKRSTSRRWLGVHVQREEWRPVAVLFCYAALLFACFYAGKTIRQLFFVEALGAEKLPLVYLLGAMISFPALWVYERMVDRLKRHTLLAGTALLMALCMAGFALLVGMGPWVASAFYIWMGIIFGIAVSQFWSYANQIFHPRQARRLFSIIAVGCGIGGIVGGQAAGRLIKLVDVTGALVVVGLMHLPLIGLIIYCERIAPKREGGPSPRRESRAEGGFEMVRRSPYLRLIALSTLLSVLAAQILDLMFSYAIQSYTTDPDRRALLFGLFYSLTSLAALIVQLVLTARFHRAFGVGAAMKVLPVSVLLGTTLMLIFGGSAMAFMLAAMALKISEGGFRHSIEQVTRELLFMPVSNDMRWKAKAFIDVFVQRFGKGASALLLLPVTFGLVEPRYTAWMILVIGAGWTLVTAAAYRRYIEAYRDGLEAGTIGPDAGVDLRDITTLEMVVHSLGSAKPNQVLYSLDLLSAAGKGHLVPPLLLYHDHPRVRYKTLCILAETGRNDACALISKCVGDDDQDVRAEAVRTLSVLQGQEAQHVLLPKLRHNDPNVRAAVIAHFAASDQEAQADAAAVALREMLSDTEPNVRAEAAKAISGIPEPLFQANLIQLLYDQDEQVILEAIQAVRSRAERSKASPVYAPTLIALMRNRNLKHECRQSLVALGEMVLPALKHFMNDPEENIWVRRAAPKTIADVGGEKAARALLDSLGEPDVFLHRKIIESLVRLRDYDVDMSFGIDTVSEYIKLEAHYCLQYIADLQSLGLTRHGYIEGPVVRWNSRPPLLLQMLAERMRERLTNLFGLVSTQYSLKDIRQAYKGLLHRRGDRRAHALEFLDNALTGNVHRYVMSVIADTPLAEKLRGAGKTFGIVVRSESDSLRRLLLAEKGIGTPALTAAAIYAVYDRKVSDLYPDIQHIAAHAEDSFVRETADWVMTRTRQPANAPNQPVHGEHR